MSRFSINLVFALIVAALALTAGVFLFRDSGSQDSQAGTAVTNALPEQHPPFDADAQIAELQRMSAGEPNNPGYPAQIGNLYYDTQRFEKAAEYYQKSLSIRPGDPNVETDLATCFHHMGQDDKALEILNRVLGYNPNFEQAKYNKGVVLIYGKKEVQAGIAVWEELLRSNPGYPQRAQLEERIRELKASAR